MKATPVLKEKRMLVNSTTDKIAIAELKIWEIPKTKDYPQGIKYSLFLVCDGVVILGFDNHKPKGPHLHLGDQELNYPFKNEKALLNDFWDLVRKAGFEI